MYRRGISTATKGRELPNLARRLRFVGCHETKATDDRPGAWHSGANTILGDAYGPNFTQ
jgi:hypothetical protein